MNLFKRNCQVLVVAPIGKHVGTSYSHLRTETNRTNNGTFRKNYNGIDIKMTVSSKIRVQIDAKHKGHRTDL